MKIRVVFIDSTDFVFEGEGFTHLSDHGIFAITTKDNNRIMLPDGAVAVIGCWNEKEQCFE